MSGTFFKILNTLFLKYIILIQTDLFSSNMAADNDNFKPKPLHYHTYLELQKISLYQYHITKTF
jgi:hypothetical protein